MQAHDTLLQAQRIIGAAAEFSDNEVMILKPGATDQAGLCVSYCNRSVRNRFGLQNEASGCIAPLLFNRQQCQRISALLQQPVAAWQEHSYAESFQCNEAEFHYQTQLVPVRLPDAEPCFICVRRLLAPPEEQGKELLSQTEILKSIVHHSSNSILYLKPDYTIVLANQTAQDNLMEMLGRPFVPGTSVLEYLSKEDAADGIKALRQMEANMEVVRYEKKMVYPKGDRWFQRKFYPTFDLHGKYNGFVVSSTDITAQKEHMIKVEQQNSKLREIANLQSHETRRPLANILSLVHLLEEDLRRLPADAQTNEHLSLLLESASQLDQVVRRIVAHTQQA